MNRKLLVILAVASLVGAPELLAQVATSPLLPSGNLTLPVGAYSTIEDGQVRIYGSFFGLNSNSNYKQPNTSSVSLSGSGQNIAADFNKAGVYVSGGIQQIQAKSSYDVSGVHYDETQHPNLLAFRVGFVTQAAIAFGVEIDSVSDSRGIDASSGSQSVSGSTTHNYSDITAGFSMPVVEAVRIGANYSPEVTSKTHYDSVFSSVESRAGHGATLLAGIGYNQPTYAIGLDGYSITESKDAGSAEAEGTIASLQVALNKDAVVSAQLSYFSSKKLVDGSNYLVPPEQGNSESIGINLRRDRMVFGFVYAQSQITASDFGNAAADANRLNSSNGSSYALRLTVDLSAGPASATAPTSR